ncbi:hypothetical protein LZ198_11630 [Myxococcus sp. K15C18031901]|uniref:hypothetical protein n=1 Tax=Myxococcus dinghuensis TaxID=2906761 RepID=UPI0020A7A561|nr:hypothetical protein [Myxococcus dinghuensis]MCP3099520.1 hypothetical protein [Myxococcus dinghuensis]
MNGKEMQGMNGVLTLELRHLDGSLMEQRRVPNLITIAGKQLVAGLLMGRVTSLPTKWAIAVGTGTQTPNPKDTTGFTKVDEAPDTAPKVEVITLSDGSSFVRATVTATLQPLTQATVQPLTEAGILIRQGGDTAVLFNWVRFEEVNRGPNMVMTMTWEISF